MKSFIQYIYKCIADRCRLFPVRQRCERVHLCLSVEIHRQVANMVNDQHRA